MNDVDFPVARVLAGIDAAAAAGLPVKVNVVVKRGLNEASVLDIARRFRAPAHGSLHRVHGRGRVERLASRRRRSGRRDRLDDRRGVPRSSRSRRSPGEVAERYRYLDGAGEIGVIASVTQPLLRRLYPSADLRGRQALHLSVRRPGSRPARAAALRLVDELEETIRAVWERRADRHQEPDGRNERASRVEMSYIGG